jgi:hypothetical protein
MPPAHGQRSKFNGTDILKQSYGCLCSTTFALASTFSVPVRFLQVVLEEANSCFVSSFILHSIESKASLLWCQ